MRHIYEHSDWPATAPGKRDCLLVETLIDTFLESHEEAFRSFERDRPEPVRRALKWLRQRIDDDPRQELRLDDIAAAAGCTAKHLCRVFAASVGHSPAHTGTLLRLQLATTLLARSNLSIKEIALKCGFADPLYFSRCFKKTFGPPTFCRPFGPCPGSASPYRSAARRYHAENPLVTAIGGARVWIQNHSSKVFSQSGRSRLAQPMNNIQRPGTTR